MPLFIPPALYYGGLAALSAGGRFLNSPTGQNVIRGGQNLFSRGLTGLKNYVNPIANMVNLGQTQGQPIQNLARMSVTSMPIIDPALNIADSLTKSSDSMGTAQAAEVDESMPPSNWMDELIEEEIEKETKNKETKKEEDKIVEIDGEFYTIDKEGKTKKLELKKGGYVKKQRKRKPYKSSGFVKIKKTKKRKYIKE